MHASQATMNSPGRAGWRHTQNSSPASLSDALPPGSLSLPLAPPSLPSLPVVRAFFRPRLLRVGCLRRPAGAPELPPRPVDPEGAPNKAWRHTTGSNAVRSSANEKT